MTHMAFVDTVKAIAAASWGKDFETEEQAQKDLLGKADLTGACLLGIVRRIDNILSALAQESIKASALKLYLGMNRKIEEHLSPLTAKHGPCPRKYKSYLEDQMYESIGRQVVHGGGVLPGGVWLPNLPSKGTEARKEYDRWMRKRVAVPAQ